MAHKVCRRGGTIFARACCLLLLSLLLPLLFAAAAAAAETVVHFFPRIVRSVDFIFFLSFMFCCRFCPTNSFCDNIDAW